MSVSFLVANVFRKPNQTVILPLKNYKAVFVNNLFISEISA